MGGWGGDEDDKEEGEGQEKEEELIMIMLTDLESFKGRCAIDWWTRW